jgi:hypothetical protein
MRYFLFTFLLISIFVVEAHSQRWKRERHHFVFGLGVTGFMGDLGGADRVGSQGFRDYDFAASRPVIGLGHRYFLYENLTITNSLAAGLIYGSDRLTDEPYRNNRNIVFRAPIVELSSTADLYVIRFQKVGARYRALTRRRSGRGHLTSGFIFAGVAGFYFNPQGYFDAAQYKGQIPAETLPSSGWYNLRPLKTEGQGYFPTRQQYSPFSIAIPFGIGATIEISDEYAIGFRYGFRKTFTDYIDDVSKTYVDPAIYVDLFGESRKAVLSEYFSNPSNHSLSKSVTLPGEQRGNPYNTDAYMFGMITFSYRFNSGRRIYGRLRY